MNLIRCNLDRKKQTAKPEKNSPEIGAIVNSMKQVNIALQELAELVSSGCSFRPANCSGSTGKTLAITINILFGF